MLGVLMLSHSVLDIGLGILLASAVALLTLPLAKRRVAPQSKLSADGALPGAMTETERVNNLRYMEVAADEPSAAKVLAQDVRDQKNPVAVARTRRAKRIAPLGTTTQPSRDADAVTLAPQPLPGNGLVHLAIRQDNQANPPSITSNANAAAEQDNWRRGHSVHSSSAPTSDEASHEDTWTRDFADTSLVPKIDEASDQDSWTRTETVDGPAASRATPNRFASALSRIGARASRANLR